MTISATNWLTPSGTSPTGSTIPPFGKASSGNPFRNDMSGRATGSTLPNLNAASTTTDKLQIAAQSASALQAQAETATRTGNTTRLAEMATQASKILSAVTSAITEQTGTGVNGASAGTIQALSSVLGSLHAVAAQIADLLPDAGSGVSAQMAATINQLNAQAAALARRAGVNWQPVSVRISPAVSAGIGTGRTHLVDLSV